jgi:DNA polymerase-1
VKTLLVDGDNLFKIGFHGVRDLFVEGNHIGGVFHFVNTLRKQIDEHNYDKVLVFWDGDDNASVRRQIYPNYKLNRRQGMNEYKLESYHTQKSRVKEYIEECFIRQIKVDMNESDDLIAYYCKIATEEKKTILSADKDLLQLVDENTTIYSPIAKVQYTHGKKVKIGTYEMPSCNILPYKIVTGDKSDNINGIYYFGEKTLIKYFPEFLDKPVNINDILTKAKELLKEDEKNTALKNLISGKTKDGIYGEEFFQINEKIVDLQNPLISDDGKGIVEQYYADTLDPEGRGYKNLIRMMTDDGFFKYLGKSDDEFLRFIQPFMKLTRKEKRKFREEK